MTRTQPGDDPSGDLDRVVVAVSLLEDEVRRRVEEALGVSALDRRTLQRLILAEGVKSILRTIALEADGGVRDSDALLARGRGPVQVKRHWVHPFFPHESGGYEHVSRPA